MRRTFFLLPLLCLPVLLSAAPAPTTRPAALDRDFELTDVAGTPRRPLAAAQADGAKAVVFLFIATDCPISNSYAPEFNRICAKYGREEQKAGKGTGGAKDDVKGDAKSDSKAFDFYLVHADPDLLAADAKKHASDYGYGCPVLMDGKKQLAGQLGAKATPEAFVVSPDGKVLYRGRIDDQYAGYGKRRAEPTTHDLRDALDAVLAGKPVAVPETKVIGCPIE